MNHRTPTAAVALCLALAGCEIRDPYTTPTSTPGAPSTTTAATAGGVALTAPASASAADTVVQRFARAWTNWTPATLPVQRRVLVALAAPSYASELTATTAQAQLASRTPDSPGERGSILSEQLAPGTGRRRGVVVLTQQPTLHAQAAGPAVTSVYIVQTVRRGGRWQIEQWTPQP